MSTQSPKNALNPLLEGYLAYLTDVGRKTPRTVIDVRCTLKRVCQVLSQLKVEKALHQAALTDYLRWIEHERQQGRSSAHLNKQLSHVRGFLEYAWRSGRCDRNVLDNFRLQDLDRSREPTSLSIDEAARLIKSCPVQTPVERRDRVVILLLYGCGLRTHELCALDVQGVDAQRKELQVEVAKGDRPRIVPIPDAVHTELLAYLLERGGKRGPLFRTTAKHRALSAHEVCQIVSAAAQRAGITGTVTPKTLRHSYATHLMDQGVDLAVIARLMGHRSPRETGVYLHALQGQPQEAVARLSPRKESSPGEDPPTGDAVP
jgi:integrase/recombinase XerD